MKKILILSFSLIFFLLPLRATVFYNIFTNENYGINRPSIYAIDQDELGRMWFGSSEGLIVHNGQYFQKFKGKVTAPNGQELWLGNFVSLIKSDENGNMFVLSADNLFWFDIKHNQYTQLTTGDNTSTFTLKEGKIWYVQTNQVRAYDIEQKKDSFVTELPKTKVTSLMIRKDSIFAGTLNGLIIADRKMSSVTRELTHAHIYRLFECSKGELWIGTANNGVYKYENGQIIKVPYIQNDKSGIHDNQIRDFIEDTDHNIWIATSKGPQMYDRATNTYKLVHSPRYAGGLTSPSVYAIFQDKSGKIWVGSYLGGASCFNPGTDGIIKYTYQSIYPESNKILCIGEIVEDKNKNLWLSTDGEGITCVSPKWETLYRLNDNSKEKLPTNKIKSISYDSLHNQLYIGMHHAGLARYDLNSKKLLNFSWTNEDNVSKHNQSVLHIEVAKNKVYFSTPNGLYTLNHSNNKLELILPMNEQCIDFKISPNDTIYARLANKLLIIPLANPSNNTFIDLKEKGYKGIISSLALVSDKLYLYTIGNGIIYYDLNTHTLTNICKDNSSIASDFCFQAKQLSNGKIIITCDQGVMLHDPSKETFKLLREQSLIRECGIYVTKTDAVYVSGIRSVTLFHEKDFYTQENQKIALSFYKLYINNQEVRPLKGQKILSTILPYTKEIFLKPHQNNLIINFAYSIFSNRPIQKAYMYKLEGADNTWNYTTNPSVNYTNLQPGDYTLLAKIVEDAPIGSVAKLRIHIATPWYDTWWAWAIYVVIIISIVTVIVRYTNRQRELALSLKNERFEKQKIEQLSHEKFVFFTNVSHEFRTPLTLIISYIDCLLRYQGLPTPIYNVIDKLQKNSQYLNNLVSELLDFRKFTQNYFTLNLQELNYCEFIQEIYLTFCDYANQHRITLSIESDASCIMGWFDMEQMEKVFFNLLSNALKNTPSDGKISINIKQMEEHVIISVSDTGHGMSEEDAKQIFKRFYQIDHQGSDRQTHGTGIGLALTKTIVEKHHGTISIESEKGKGSTFIVELPLSKHVFVNDEHVVFIEKKNDGEIIPIDLKLLETTDTLIYNDEISSQEVVGNKILDKKGSTTLRRKILLVEDNKELLMLLKQLFDPYYETFLAENGKEGLEKTKELRPDLIISDIMMPEMSGTEMCLSIKNNIDLCHTPIILLTALNSSKHNIEGLNRGADDYISKPFHGELLLARANNLIRNRLLIQSQFSKKPVSEINLTSINPLDQKFLDKVDKILLQNLDNCEFEIADLCKNIGMGRSVLFSKFKALTGMTPNNFIVNYRLKHAASLLYKSPEIPIAEISDLCGFKTSVYFSRCFKQQYGKSPQNYRKDL